MNIERLAINVPNVFFRSVIRIRIGENVKENIRSEEILFYT